MVEVSRRRGERSLVSRAVAWALLLSIGFAAGCGGVSLEERFFFQPKADLVGTPAARGISFTEVWFGPEDGLHGWFVPGRRDITVLWLHGNGGNISHRLELLQELYGALEASFFLFDYHGYGRSRGAPSEAGLYSDARAALTYLRSRTDTSDDRIVYFGKSLGTAVAVELAIEEPPDRLVIQSGFTSVHDLASWYAPVLPLGTLLSIHFPSIDRIGRVQAPVLVIHGDRDTVVPLEQGRLLYETVAGPKCLLVVEGAGHEDVASLGGQRYLDALRAFTESLPDGSSHCRSG